MNTDVNTTPENNQLKTAVTLATAAEIIKTALIDVFQNEVPPSDADILRYLVIESNH